MVYRHPSPRRRTPGEHLELTDRVIYRQTPGPIRIELSREVLLMIDGDLPLTGKCFDVEVLPGRFPVFVG